MICSELMENTKKPSREQKVLHSSRACFARVEAICFLFPRIERGIHSFVIQRRENIARANNDPPHAQGVENK